MLLRFVLGSGSLAERSAPVLAVLAYDREIHSLVVAECSNFFIAVWIRNQLYVTFVLSPLWSSGQSFWLQIQRSRVRSPALPDFLSSSGSGTESTQPREVN